MNAKELTLKINTTKNMFVTPVKRDRIIEALGVSIKNQTFKSIFTKYFLERIDKSNYVYRDKVNPIFVGRVRIMLDEYNQLLKGYNKTSYNRRKNPKIEIVEVNEVSTETNDLEKAIELVKAHGYKIFKVVESLEEI